MSYAIVKGLRIDTEKGEVWLKASSNNVSPRTYTWFESVSLSEILRAGGVIAVEKEILQQYWSGNFQGSDNLYERSVLFCKASLPYTWQNTGSEVGKERWGETIQYSYDQLKNDLYRNYVEYKSRQKGIFFVRHNGYFVRGITKRYVKFTTTTATAKRFNSREDAILFAQRISYDKASEMVVSA